MASVAGLKGAAASAGTVGTWALFLPPLDKLWHADPDDGPPRNLRSGQAVLFGMAILFGGLQSAVAGDPLPLIVALAIAAATACFYEYAFRTSPEG